MDNLFASFLHSLISLLVCMFAGFICRKSRLLDDSLTSGLTLLLVKMTLPCTVFMSMMRPFSQTLLQEGIMTLLLSAVIYLSGGLLGVIIVYWLKPKPDEKSVFIFSLVFANVGYMGFPVIQAVFGDEGMMYASMANVSFNLLAFSLGIRLFSNKEKIKAKNLIINPAMIATLAGFALFVTGLRLPAAVNGGIGMISNMTTPVSMLLVGSILAKCPLRSLLGDIRTVPVIFFRLIAIPVVSYLILRIFITNHVMLGVIVVLAAMPCAALTAIFAQQYNGNTQLASKMVALSTIVSIATVPVLSLILGII